MADETATDTMTKSDLKTEFAESLKYIRESVQETGSFIKEQAPDVAMQYVVYQRIHSTSMVCVGLLFFIICSITTRRSIQKLRESLEPEEELYIPLIVFSIFGLGASCMTIYCSFVTSVKAWYAPKILILEYIKSLL